MKLYGFEFYSLSSFIFDMKGSVWSALPPINTSSSESSKHIILAVASMDSASFFRDKSLGADSPISVSSSILTQFLSLQHQICFYIAFMTTTDQYKIFLNECVGIDFIAGGS